jgi:hypothetical protein
VVNVEPSSSAGTSIETSLSAIATNTSRWRSGSSPIATDSAVAAGWQAALILRAGNAPLDVGPPADYIGTIWTRLPTS